MDVDELDWGPQRLRTWASDVKAAIAANKPKEGLGIKITEGDDGTAISADDDGDGDGQDPSSGAGSGGGGGALTVADDAGDEVDDAEYITFGFVDAEDAAGGVDVVEEDDDGDAVVTMGVSNQFYIIIDGALKVINLLGDPTEGNGIPQDP